jgi:hypothetical protein
VRFVRDHVIGLKNNVSTYALKLKVTVHFKLNKEPMSSSSNGNFSSHKNGMEGGISLCNLPIIRIKRNP